MSTGTPPAGNESGESGGPIEHISCTTCGHALVFSGPRPLFCGFCGKPLPRPTPESTVVVPPPVGPESPTLTPSPSAGVSMVVEEPQSVGGYRLLRRLGGGGMGTVYEAEGPGGHRVALKLIGGGCPGSEDAVERFRREGRLASALSHPRCVFVLAADEDAGRPYIVMELMPGRTLADLVRERGPLPPGEAVAKALDVLEGLREAHRLGVVHRDVKPSNCFLEADGRVKVGDFGLSKSLAGDARLTQSGAFLGTPLYASPEQVRGEALAPQSDVYSLAATLYFLLAGKAPFEGGDAAATLARIASDPAPPLRPLRPEVSPALERAVLRGLERDRQRRWRDLDEFREALLPFVPGRQDAAGRGVRLGAFLVDYVVVKAVGVLLVTILFAADVLSTDDTSGALIRRLAVVQFAVPIAIWLLYFVPQESLWGCTPGKRLLRLRVCTSSGRDLPSWGKALLRFGVFYTLMRFGEFASLPWLEQLSDPTAQNQEPHVSVRFQSVDPIGLLVLCSTMRRRNGWRGLHEFASGTRVVQLPEAARRGALVTLPLVDLSRPENLPGRVGPFAVRGALRWDDGVRLLAGEDPSLGRPVLLWLRPPDEPPLSPARRACARSTRLRWLASGRHDGWQWDAFPAPAGRPLGELVREGGPLDWPAARPVLEQLTEELAAAEADGTLPDSLTTGRVWVHSGGALLLDVPLRPEAKDAADTSVSGSLDLVARSAVLALEGRPREDAGHVRAPVPPYAGRLLDRLLGAGKPYADAREFARELEATRDRPAEVAPGRRAAHVVVLSAAVFIGLFSMILSAWLREVPGLIALRETQKEGLKVLRRLEAPAASGRAGEEGELAGRLQERLDAEGRELEARVGSADPLNRITYHWVEQRINLQQAREAETAPDPDEAGDAREQARRWLKDDDTVMQTDLITSRVALALLPGWVSLWVLSAFVFRGGLTYPLMGLSLVGADGRPAGRLRCAGRAFLAWAPPAALLAASVLLDAWNWSAGGGGGRTWVSWLVQALRWGSLGVLAVYPVLAIRSPRQAPHDRLAGTYVVPR